MGESEGEGEGEGEGEDESGNGNGNGGWSTSVTKIMCRPPARQLIDHSMSVRFADTLTDLHSDRLSL